MKDKQTFGVVVIAVVLTLFIAVGVPALRKTSPVFNILVPPTDLYSPLSASPVSLADEGQRYLRRFENKYPGQYWIAIRVNSLAALDAVDVGDFVLRLDVSTDNRQVFSNRIEGPFERYERADSGFAVYRYRVPEDLPIREPLTATLTIVRADEQFESAYGPSELVIKKLSDQ